MYCKVEIYRLQTLRLLISNIATNEKKEDMPIRLPSSQSFPVNPLEQLQKKSKCSWTHGALL